MTQTTKKTYSFISLNMISIEINFNIDDVNWGQKFVEGSFLLCLNLIQSWKNENNLFTSHTSLNWKFDIRLKWMKTTQQSVSNSINKLTEILSLYFRNKFKSISQPLTVQPILPLTSEKCMMQRCRLASVRLWKFKDGGS